jgi:hypothetical protein
MKIIGKLKAVIKKFYIFIIGIFTISCASSNQRLNIYDFTYYFIPYFANEVYTGNLSPEALVDKKWIKETADC